MGFKFKAGDKVIVNKEFVESKRKRDLQDDYDFVNNMYKTIGKVLTITYEETFRDTGNIYYVKENGYYYHEDLLLPYNPKKSNVRRH